MKTSGWWVTTARRVPSVIALLALVFSSALDLTAQTITIAPLTLPPGSVGNAYSQPLTATGGTAPYTWSLVPLGGLLPLGLTLSAAGVISGTPLSTGTSNFTVQVNDSAARTKTQAFSIIVNPSLVVTTTSPLPFGTAGAAYSQSLTASGGAMPYIWKVLSGTLPTGLVLSTAGVISGTPTVPGPSNFTVQVTEAGSATASHPLSLTINPAPLSITTTSLPAGVVGTAYSQTLAASGGSPPYSWTVSSGTLPGGLALSSAGVISGTPTSAGTSTPTFRVTDSASQPQQKPLSITINTPLVVTTTSPLPAGTTGVAYSQTLAASGGTPPYAWTLFSGTLPPGLDLSSAGVISGTPTAAGGFNFTVRVSDAGSQTANHALAVTINAGPPSITTASLPGGAIASPYSQTLAAAGGTPPYAWSIATGTLPAGLTLSGTGVISGTPTTGGTSNFTVRVTDTSSPARQATKALSINIAGALTISSAPPPPGVVGSTYGITLSATGGTAPYSWSLAAGILPPGIALSSGGVLSGTPLVRGNFSVTLRVSDSGTPPQTATQTSTIVIANPLTILTQSTLGNASTGVPYSISLGVTGGTPPYTWTLAAGELPIGLILSSDGTLAGTPTTAGNFNFNLRVSDASGAVVARSFTLAVQTGLTITTASPLPNAVINSSYSQQIQASIGNGLTWSVISGNLPPGIAISPSGILSGTPTSLGVFEFTVQVTGGTPQQTATQLFKLEVSAALAITNASPLPDGTTFTPYTVILAATGGVAPYTWSPVGGSLPDGLELSTSGLISGRPTRVAVFTFTVQVADSSSLKATKTFTISITAPATGTLSLVNVPDTVNPTQQLAIALALSAPQPAPVSGTLSMTFISNSVVSGNDPAVQFSTGSRTVTFTIPANSTSAVFPTTVLLLIGTVSGTVNLTADLQGGPTAAPVGTIAIRQTIPQLSNIAAARTSTGLRIQITGFSPERRVVSADFGFDVTTASGTQRVNLTRSVEPDFDTWYKSAASAAFGSSFFFEQLFTVQGDTSTIQSVTIKLTNGAGSASSAAVTISPN